MLSYLAESIIQFFFFFFFPHFFHFYIFSEEQKCLSFAIVYVHPKLILMLPLQLMMILCCERFVQPTSVRK